MLVPGVGESDAIVLSAWYMLEDYDDDLKLGLILHEVGHYAGFDHPEDEGHDWWPESCGEMPEKEDEGDDPPPTSAPPPVPSVNPDGYPVLGQDVSCTYVFNPLGGDLYCKGLTIIAEEGWYFEERLGLAFWFSSNGDGTASVTVCRPDGEWEQVCEDGTGKPAPSG